MVDLSGFSLSILAEKVRQRMAGMPDLVNQRRPRWRFHLSGGRIFLDLANTVSWRAGSHPIDRL